MEVQRVTKLGVWTAHIVDVYSTWIALTNQPIDRRKKCGDQREYDIYYSYIYYMSIQKSILQLLFAALYTTISNLQYPTISYNIQQPKYL